MNEEYLHAIEYIEKIPLFAPKRSLENTAEILKLSGDPLEGMKAVHIAGTNGKGSVSKMLSLMFKEAGYKTGLFISPHLVKINERISVNGEDISDEKFAEVFRVVKSAIDENGFEHPAYFEFLFLMAAVYFRNEKCDMVIWETGLGGRLDATNTVNPMCCVITSVGFDHMQYLGNTVEKIAFEKAGIIKEGVPVISHLNHSGADEVIEKAASDKNAPLITVDNSTGDGCIISDPEGVTGSVTTAELIKKMRVSEYLPDAPIYQNDNFYTAVTAFYAVRGSGMYDSATGRDSSRQNKKDKHLEYESGSFLPADIPELIKRAMSHFFWPGRMQALAPNIYIDGAHNTSAVIKFTESVLDIFNKKHFSSLRILFAVCADKDYEDMIKIISEKLQPEKVYVSEIASGRKLGAEYAAKLFLKYGSECFGNDDADKKHDRAVIIPDPHEAVLQAKTGLSDDVMLVIVGSLYLAGEVLSEEIL